MTGYLFKTLEIEGGTLKAKPETYSNLGSFHFADHSSDPCKETTVGIFWQPIRLSCFGIFMAIMDMYGHLDMQELLYFLQALSPWVTR